MPKPSQKTQPGPSLARELHDGICQELSSILFLAKCVEQRLEKSEPEADGELFRLTEKIAEAATRSIEKAQELVHRYS